jgi:nitrate/nitrite-specific signal transduction histidine kinase
MKSFIALALFCLMTVGTAQAQKLQSKPALKIEQAASMDMLAKKLGLTVEQKANVAKTITAFEQTKSRIQASTLSEADKSKKLASIDSRMKGNLKTYLSEDQYAQYLALKKVRK